MSLPERDIQYLPRFLLINASADAYEELLEQVIDDENIRKT